MGEARRRKEILGDEYGKIVAQSYFSDKFYNTYAPDILRIKCHGDIKETLSKLSKETKDYRDRRSKQPMYSLAVWNTRDTGDLLRRCLICIRESFTCLKASRAARETLLDGYQLTFNAIDDSPMFGAYVWVPWSYFESKNQVEKSFNQAIRDCYTQENLSKAIFTLTDKQTLDYCAAIALILTIETYKEHFGLLSRMITETWLFLMSSTMFLCSNSQEPT